MFSLSLSPSFRLLSATNRICMHRVVRARNKRRINYTNVKYRADRNERARARIRERSCGRPTALFLRIRVGSLARSRASISDCIQFLWNSLLSRDNSAAFPSKRVLSHRARSFPRLDFLFHSLAPLSFAEIYYPPCYLTTHGIGQLASHPSTQLIYANRRLGERRAFFLQDLEKFISARRGASRFSICTRRIFDARFPTHSCSLLIGEKG